MRELVLIWAMAANRVIGKDGDLPWRLREDLRHFRRNTVGHAVIMGRKTWDSLGKPLGKRRNIVVSRSLRAAPEGAELARSLDEAIARARTTDDAPRIIGGGQIYAAALPLATELLITELAAEHDGDTIFPPFDEGAWVEVERHPHDGFAFRRLRRRGDEAGGEPLR